MIDKWDIELFKRFLSLACKEGTDSIKVVTGNAHNTWVVTIIDKKEAK